MSSESSLTCNPPELCFQPDQSRQLSSTVQLSNGTDNCVAFKLKSTNPRNYVVRPRIGILLPRSSCEIKVVVTMRAMSHSLRCKDKFMIESVVTAADPPLLEDARKLFDKDAGLPIQEFIIRAVHSRPAESSPRTSTIENTDALTPEGNNSLREPVENCLQVPSSVAEPRGNDIVVTNYIPKPRDNDSQEANVSIRGGESILRGFISNYTGESTLRRFISNCTGESILREVIGNLLGSLLVLLSLYLMKQTISWIWSLVMFAVMVIIKMIKKLVSDSVEDWIVKTLLHIVMYILFGRQNNATTQA